MCKVKFCILVVVVLFLSSCEFDSWNNPYAKADDNENIYYSSFSERPKYLDPAKSYSSNEWDVIGQIYESPFEYHYLKRPYVLEPLLATELADFTNGKANATGGYRQEIEITIKPDIYYQPHPAFKLDMNGDYKYHNLNRDVISKLNSPYELDQDKRELTADDFVYQIKRLADPNLSSPIFSIMQRYILGLTEFRDELLKIYAKHPEAKVDLRDIPLVGVKVNSRYSYSIILKQPYPQIKYWLGMPFFAPIPWEADIFYNQDGMSQRNITQDWYPVGTGPYMLIENNPAKRMTLVRNPNYHGSTYPSEGEEGDRAEGLLDDAGKKLPFLDKVVFTLEKESIPYWNKFLQGYYDASGISSDTFHTAVNIGPAGGFSLDEDLIAKGVKLRESVSVSTMYWAFNMLDPVVGGYTYAKRKLRQAISIAFDVEEFISIFLNDRAIVANGPIPPQIRGHEPSINKYVYNDNNKRKSIAIAKKLLSQAGYPNGIDPKTDAPLKINFDTVSSGDPNEKALFAWLKKQMHKIGIQLEIRATDHNRFSEKASEGNSQMFFWGWNADYPDAENFLFLFYGPNSKAKFSGQNTANYMNKNFDKLFVELQAMVDSPERDLLIQQAVTILQYDMPWIWGFHPKIFQLIHTWNKALKPNSMARNTIKYKRINPKLRAELRAKWNKPKLWPLVLLPILITVLVLPATIVSYSKNKRKMPRFD